MLKRSEKCMHHRWNGVFFSEIKYSQLNGTVRACIVSESGIKGDEQMKSETIVYTYIEPFMCGTTHTNTTAPTIGQRKYCVLVIVYERRTSTTMNSKAN